jgi:hypothetical protein
MSRRTSGSPSFLFLIVFVVLFFLVAQRHIHRRSPAPYLSGVPHARSSETRRQSESMTREALGVKCDSRYFQQWQTPAQKACRTRIRNGYPVPDPRCTPGGFNTSITENVLRNPAWRTAEIRNCEVSEAEKHATYKWYGLQKPRVNSGKEQVCELDHLVPLELGGADGLGNIWPECGPDATTLDNRYFKIKDHVENYLADEVKAGRISLETAQQGIASDWTQFLVDAERYCVHGGRC